LRKAFDQFAGATGEIKAVNGASVIILDATFFGRGYGILMARNLDKVLCWHEITSESMNEYEYCFKQLEAMEYLPNAFVIDGRMGVKQLLAKRYPNTPIQFCQFHQIQIVKRYIPAKTKIEASKELRRLALQIVRSSESNFKQMLLNWYERHKEFVNEKTIIPGTKRWNYTHRRLRSAYRSLNNNLPNLFTFEKYPHLKIPNTTNHCDGLFSHLKQKIGIHRGISTKRRKQMIDYFLENF
jgi:hypothetical protein